MAKKKKRSRKRKPSKPDSRVVITGEPFKAIAGLFAKGGSPSRSSPTGSQRRKR